MALNFCNGGLAQYSCTVWTIVLWLLLIMGVFSIYLLFDVNYLLFIVCFLLFFLFINYYLLFLFFIGKHCYTVCIIMISSRCQYLLISTVSFNATNYLFWHYACGINNKFWLIWKLPRTPALPSIWISSILSYIADLCSIYGNKSERK